MSLLARWWRFNLVGLVGLAVQLGVLAVLNRVLRGHYLVASTVAIELTLLHNFVWHVHYTWPDRSQDRRDWSGGWLRPLLRFQVSNGMVSLLGNVLLMRLLVHGSHLPVVLASLAASACCAVVNFGLGNGWAFAEPPQAPAEPPAPAPARLVYPHPLSWSAKKRAS